MALYMTEEEFQKLKQRWSGKTAACSKPAAPKLDFVKAVADYFGTGIDALMEGSD